jgi:hypothetical protein
MAPSCPSFTGIAFTGTPVTKDYVDNNVAGSYYGSPEPDYQEQHYVMKDATGQSLGIFKGPVDKSITSHFTLYQPDQPECATMRMEATLLDPMDFSTQVAFETLPILEVWHYVQGGVLLKFPD